MDTRVAPGLIAHPFTAWDVYLGYSLPGPPDVVSLVSLWRVDLVVGVAAVVGAVGYVVAAGGSGQVDTGGRSGERCRGWWGALWWWCPPARG